MLGKTHVNLGVLAATTVAKITLAPLPTLGTIIVFNLVPYLARYAILIALAAGCYMFPKEMMEFTVPLAVVVGSLLPDLDHPNSTLSNMIAPTGTVIRILLAIAGGIVIMYGWNISGWLVVAGIILALAAVLNIKIIPLEALQRIMLIGAGLALIAVSQQSIAVILGIIYITMGLLSHRGLTHSVEGAILAIACAWWLLQGTAYSYLLIPFAVGYVVHLLADLVTNSGIYITFIGKIKLTMPLIKTGSIVDRMIGFAGLILVVAVLYLL